MSQDPNHPLTPPGDQGTATEADRPAPGPHAAGDPGTTFPRDEGLEGQTNEGSRDSDLAYPPRSGAPQEVDPGLADQRPGGPAERPAWGRDPAGGTGSTYPSDEPQTAPGTATSGVGSAAAEAPQTADRPQAGVHEGGTVEEPPLDRFRQRWPSVQGAFVDDPKAAVTEADRLVAEVIQDVEQRLTRRRQHIQSQWSGGESDTEQLRQLIHGYRALFHRLLETEF